VNPAAKPNIPQARSPACFITSASWDQYKDATTQNNKAGSKSGTILKALDLRLANQRYPAYPAA
jgi:hypothetical protein